MTEALNYGLLGCLFTEDDTNATAQGFDARDTEIFQRGSDIVE